MALLEVGSSRQSVRQTYEHGADEVFSFKVETKIVQSLRSYAQFRVKKIASIFLAAYHILLYRYNPSRKDVSVAVSGRSAAGSGAGGPVPNVTGGGDKPFVISVLFHGMDTVEQGAAGKATQRWDAVQKGKGMMSFMEVLSQVESRMSEGKAELAVEECKAGFELCASPSVASRGESSILKLHGCDLFLQLTLVKDGSLSARFQYSSALYNADLIRTLAHSYVRLVDFLSLGTGPVETPIHSLPVLSEHEQEAVLNQFSKRHVSFAREDQVADLTLVDMLERQARVNPETVAVVENRRSVSYQELYNRARKVASALLRECSSQRRKQSDSQSVIVGLGLERGVDWVVGMMGVLMAGMGYCPLDPSCHPRAHNEELVKQTEVKIVLTNGASIHAFAWVALESRARLLLVEDQREGTADSTTLDEVRPGPDAVCCVLQSSASAAGGSVRVALEHRGVVNTVRALGQLSPLHGPGVRGQLAPATDYLHTVEIFSTLRAGGTLAIWRKEEIPLGLSAFVNTHLVTGAFLNPALAGLLNPDEVPSLRWLAIGGAEVPRSLVTKWRAAARVVVEFFGQSECSGIVACQVSRPGEPAGGDHVGRPLDGNHLFVLGPCLELLPIGVAGELCVGGVQVSARGYWKRPDLTTGAFRENPYSTAQHSRWLYKTGECARWLPGGDLQCLGRLHADGEASEPTGCGHVAATEGQVEGAGGVGAGEGWRSTAGEGAECIVCWERFDSGSTPPHVLWCGHSLCRDCVIGLPSASFTQIPQAACQLPFLIPCPWCRWLTLRLRWKGRLVYPCKNFSLVWMMEAARGPAAAPASPPAPASEAPGLWAPAVKDAAGVARGGQSRRGAPDGAAAGQSAAATSASGTAAAVAATRQALGTALGAGAVPQNGMVAQNRGRSGGLEVGNVVVPFVEAMVVGVRLALKLIRKLPLLCLLVFLMMVVLPLSGLVLGIYFATSIFFAIPSSAVAIATISFSDFLLREIMR